MPTPLESILDMRIPYSGQKLSKGQRVVSAEDLAAQQDALTALQKYKINPDSWTALLLGMPESNNVQDRRAYSRDINPFFRSMYGIDPQRGMYTTNGPVGMDIYMKSK